MTDPAVARLVARILQQYHESSIHEVFVGKHWLTAANTLATNLARRYKVTLEVAACVLAAHSMDTDWKSNVARAEAQLAGSPVGLPNAIRMSAEAMAHPGNPFPFIVGPKINPFARNVAGDEQAVATDRWAQRAAYGTNDLTACRRLVEAPGGREQLITAYHRAAAAVGLTPAVMQSIIWVHMRDNPEDIGIDGFTNSRGNPVLIQRHHPTEDTVTITVESPWDQDWAELAAQIGGGARRAALGGYLTEQRVTTERHTYRLTRTYRLKD